MYNVYLIGAEFDGRTVFKIGFTRRKVEERIKELKTGNGSNLYEVKSFHSKWGTKIEAALHKRYHLKKIDGEWFSLDDSDIMDFSEVCQKSHDNLELISETNLYYRERGKFF